MKTLLTTLIFVAFLGILSCSSREEVTIIKSSDFELGASKDASPAMLNIMKEARKAKKAKVLIEKGIYHFYPEEAFEKFCFVSNHHDGLRYTPFPLIGFRDLEIVADGAEFIFHGRMIPFIIEESENIRLSGFTIDWELPLSSEMEVVAVDEKNHTFDMRVDCPYEIRNSELIFIKEGYEHKFSISICWDTATMAPSFNHQEVSGGARWNTARSVTRFAEQAAEYYLDDPDDLPYQRTRGKELSLRAREVSPGIIRISGHKRTLPKKGWIVYSGGDSFVDETRSSPAFRVDRSRDIRIEDVTIHHCGGMGIIAERTENVSLKRFNVALRPGSGRVTTASADATHFTYCRGLVEMEDCLFENMLDDATNVHGTYVRVREILDANTVGVVMGHFQQQGYVFGESGDLCGFTREGGSYDPFLESRLAGVEEVNKRYYILRFEKELEGVQVGDLVDNLDWYPEVRISNCTIRNNRARGLLFSTHHPITLENNYFSTDMSSILLWTSFSGYWYTAGRVKECTIRNNTFGDCTYGGGNRPLIYAHPGGGFPDAIDESTDRYPLRKLIIENNRFNSFNPMVLQASRIDTFIFKGNEVDLSGNYTDQFKDNPVLDISKIRHKVIKENKLEERLKMIDEGGADDRKPTYN